MPNRRVRCCSNAGVAACTEVIWSKGRRAGRRFVTGANRLSRRTPWSVFLGEVTTMTETTKKIDPKHVPAAAMTAFLGVEAAVRQGGLPPTLVHLVKLLASLRNGCAFCVDMHTK